MYGGGSSSSSRHHSSVISTQFCQQHYCIAAAIANTRLFLALMAFVLPVLVVTEKFTDLSPFTWWQHCVASSVVIA